MSGFVLTFYGVRGSYPVAGPRFRKYGGNTACLACSLCESIVVLDAGTGIINLGEQLDLDKPPLGPIHIFISHYHIDHIQGLPFFKPLYRRGNRVVIHSPSYSNGDAESLLMSLFMPPFSPIGRDSIRAEVEFRTLESEREVVVNGEARVEPVYSPTHPREGVWMFRVASGRHSLVYATDVEFPAGTDTVWPRLCRRTDVLVHDAQYLDEEYFDASHPRIDFGHSTVSMAARNAAGLDVGRLFLFHYEPSHTDAVLEASLARARKLFSRSFLARENQRIEIH